MDTKRGGLTTNKRRTLRSPVGEDPTGFKLLVTAVLDADGKALGFSSAEAIRSVRG